MVRCGMMAWYTSVEYGAVMQYVKCGYGRNTESVMWNGSTPLDMAVMIEMQCGMCGVVWNA